MELKEEKGQEKETKEKETQNEEKTYTETEHKGVITDLQRERTKRQDSEFKLSQSQTQIATLIKENEELKRKSEEKESKKSVIEGEGEDVLTKKEGRDIETKVMSSIKKAQAVVKAAEEKGRLDANFKKSVNTAKTKYAERKDIGLDWEPVYQAAMKRLGGRPYKEADIYHSDNPGEELYEEGLKDPEIKAKLELAKNEKILDTMGERKVDKKGLTGETKKYGFHYYTPEEVAGMTLEEALKVKTDIDKSALKWK